MTDKIRKKNPENHIVGFLMNLFANYGGKYTFFYFRYSDRLISTLLKDLWPNLQPCVFLGMTIQAWHTCICVVSG
jgi:hypothetical protein